MKTTLYIFLGILFLFTVWQFYGSYNNKKYETISNEIIGSINSIDFKIYDQYTKASVNTKAYNMNSASGNFPVLANYIFGGNKDNIQMEMTSPVLYNMSNKSSFSFIMPKEFEINNLPSPNSEKIFFETVKKATGKDLQTPKQLERFVDKEEKFDILDNNIFEVKKYILNKI